jgi:RHH-type proline utilization regulon transcriptional repressor/proline dehydrogenase/delta 1-pyrroline-5-carboxylate dehydrogenase
MSLERLIQEKGRAIISGAKKHAPGALSEAGFRNRLFERLQKDPYLKTQLLRFIDVLPALTTNPEVVSHLQEYIFERDVDLSFITAGAGAAKLSPALAVPVIRKFSRKMANSFIAGANVEETVKAIDRAAGQGLSFTLDTLGELTTSDRDADAYMQSYFHTLDVLSEKYGINAKDAFGNPKINLSIKISSLCPGFDPVAQTKSKEAVKDRLGRVLRRAKQVGAFINLDTEHYQFRDLTFDIFRELMEEPEFKGYDTGIVVQAYLKDAEQSLEGLTEWSKSNQHPITVRLVKGAYWDHEVMLAQKNGWQIPVFTKKWQSDECFERLTETLLRNSEYTHAAIATHNIRSMANALALAESLGTRPEHFELQMLYGMGDEIKRSLTEQGVPTRVYMPFGELIPGMGYFVRRLLENSANESFLRAFDKNADIDVLLRRPGE